MSVVVGPSNGPVKTDGRLFATVDRGAIDLTPEQRTMFTNMTVGLCDQEVTGNSVGVWHVRPISGGSNGRSASRTASTGRGTVNGTITQLTVVRVDDTLSGWTSNLTVGAHRDHDERRPR